MGSVPISVIMGFDYPLESDRESSGRGEQGRELRREKEIKSSYTNKYSTALNTDYMNRHMQERLPRTSSAVSSWPSSLSHSRTPTQKTYLSRATTEARELEPLARPDRSYGVTSSFALEHPKQQPCHYASALSMTARQQPKSRHSRAVTVMPPSTSFSQSRSSFSSYASKFSSPGNSFRFTNIRSRFF